MLLPLYRKKRNENKISSDGLANRVSVYLFDRTARVVSAVAEPRVRIFVRRVEYLLLYTVYTNVSRLKRPVEIGYSPVVGSYRFDVRTLQLITRNERMIRVETRNGLFSTKNRNVVIRD